MKTTTVGNIVNLMSVDCQRIQDSLTYSYFIISIIDYIIMGMIQLWALMGVASLGAFSVIIALAPCMLILGGMQQKLQMQILNLKGRRINLLNEIMSGIKVGQRFQYKRQNYEWHEWSNMKLGH